MSEACPTCGTSLPSGAQRCPGCGRVFGEDNRCPHCHAIAAIRAAGDGYVCVACSKPRERKPLTTVLGEGPSRSSIVPSGASSARGRGLRSVGVLALGAGVLGAALATALLGLGVLGIGIAAASAIAGAFAGITLLRRASSADDRARAFADSNAETRVRGAAQKLGGDVTAKAVAEALGVPVAEADAVLTRMSDGTEVTVEVDTDDGSLHYVFQSIVQAAAAARAKVRVADDVGRGTDPEIASEEDAKALEDLEQRKSRI